MSATEYAIGRHCGVTFAGLKIASLVSLRKGEEDVIQTLSRRFAGKGFAFILLREDEERLPKLITNVYNSLPSWENNGWSPQELLERMAGKKVFYNERGDVMKVGRNDPCPCGSGKKYKKCCGR